MTTATARRIARRARMVLSALSARATARGSEDCGDDWAYLVEGEMRQIDIARAALTRATVASFPGSAHVPGQIPSPEWAAHCTAILG